MFFLNKKIIFSLLLVIITPKSFNASKKIITQEINAVTIVPVADATLQKLGKLYSQKRENKRYTISALEGKKTDAHSCPRVHQLLFNEQVQIIDQQGDEYLIRIPNVFYITKNNKQKKYNTYWSHKKNFITLKTLKQKGINLNHLPQPIHHNKTSEYQNKNIVTLTMPFYDKKTDKTFSAGTRFVRAFPKKSKNATSVFIINLKKNKIDIISVPQKLCLTSYPKNKKEQRDLFIKIIQKWAHLSDGFIPYVWGGCSFTKLYNKQMISHPTQINRNKKHASIFKNKNKNMLVSGFDCTGLVCRAAQIIGIPYFFKNSFTAAQYLTKITNFNKLKQGDILYFPGHVMIVSDIKKNTILEARTHTHGFGKLHEKKLGTIFKGIRDYKTLISFCKQKKPLKRLDINGKICQTIIQAQFLQLPLII
ncbi:hypothetical protein KAH94_01150 [bacterium]|nr:hypothetical protein [bacterium]